MKKKDEITAFQLGYSTVITLPKDLGIRPGNKFKVRKDKKRVILEETKLTEDETRKLVKRLSGGLNFGYDPTPEELNEELDKRYEEMLPRL